MGFGNAYQTFDDSDLEHRLAHKRSGVGLIAGPPHKSPDSKDKEDNRAGQASPRRAHPRRAQDEAKTQGLLARTGPLGRAHRLRESRPLAPLVRSRTIQFNAMQAQGLSKVPSPLCGLTGVVKVYSQVRIRTYSPLSLRERVGVRGLGQDWSLPLRQRRGTGRAVAVAATAVGGVAADGHLPSHFQLISDS